MPVSRAIAAPMKRFTITGLTLLCTFPAYAIVGGGTPTTEGVGRAIVTIVGSRGNFCTGALIAPKIALTAAHCVQPGADYKIVETGADRQPRLQDVTRVAIHPAFKIDAMMAHRATADVALLQLAAPVAGTAPAVLGGPTIPVMAGSRFTIAGIGVTVRGDGKSGGTIRVAGLVATGKPGTLQIRLVDPLGQGAREGMGACTGDSGGPVFEDKQTGPAIVGVISWSTGPNMADGCGGTVICPGCPSTETCQSGRWWCAGERSSPRRGTSASCAPTPRRMPRFSRCARLLGCSAAGAWSMPWCT